MERKGKEKGEGKGKKHILAFTPVQNQRSAYSAVTAGQITLSLYMFSSRFMKLRAFWSTLHIHIPRLSARKSICKTMSRFVIFYSQDS